ncbi:MAG: elongation factor P maturation arginine rhamnosyltransferase EarP [Nitrosomonas sp.]|nr:MAG: elongation factor P maturation arginine rhamnosyltransferase EarP [Nitrosomonas sp.]
MQCWDIFCTVVDNFGDIGVCWRLARQLTREHHKQVRLWVDDLESFNRIAPDVDPAMEWQKIQDVQVFHWQSVFHAIEPGDVVIEAFACELPEVYVRAMLRRAKQPIWVNLEYLSAESWVCRYHGLPSPHPRFPLIKTFFFPGFVRGTGGLLRENDLLVQQRVFNIKAESAFLSSKHVPVHQCRELRISLFGYDSAPVDQFIAILSAGTTPVRLILPAGRISQRILAYRHYEAMQTATVITQGQVTIQIIPFLEQSEYDRLLWSCDINFVRGEDSFVRAQWAGKPFIWNVYPQSEDAHWHKLSAFLDLYMAGISRSAAQAVRAMSLGWNGKFILDATVWLNFLAVRESLIQHNRNWINQLLKQDDLVTNLVRFADNKL